MKQFFRKNKLLLGFVLFTNMILAQSNSITGTVVDEKGSSLPSINIVVDGTNESTQTDIDGKFKINASKGQVLKFTYVGMESQNVTIGNSSIITVKMKDLQNVLTEVVVTGYSKQSTRNVTGSVTVVKAKDIAATSPVSIEQSLQGQASGVQVGQEGGPGGSSSVRIRGFGTVNNNDPLYIIDGTPTTTGMNMLNPADIESVQVLKDASSAAIYGFRAGNGVIIITTKSGKYNSDTKFTFSSNTGLDFISESDFPKMITPMENAQIIWQRAKNSGTTPSHPQYGSGPTPVLPNYLTPGGADTVDESTYNAKTNKITRANKEGTDWFDEFFNPAFVQNYNFGMSGGSEKAKFNVGLGALNQDGVALETYFNRYSLRINSEFKASKNLKFGQSLSTSYSEKVSVGGNQNADGNVEFIYRADPILPVYDIAGNYAGTRSTGLGNGHNAIANMHRNKDNIARDFRTLGSFYGELNIVKGLSFKSNLGYDLSNYNGSYFKSLDPEVSEPTPTNSLREENGYTISTTWFNTLNYTATLNKHHFDVLGGTEFFNNMSKNFGAERSIYFTENLDYRYLDAGSGLSTNYGNGSKRAYFSAFGKLDYNYDDKYLLSFSMRRDATSRFAESNRVGYFPSYSAAWRISKENFMKEATFISDLKIKAGYGELGNESIPEGRVYDLYGNNQGNSNYAINGSNSSTSSGYNLSSFGNSNLTWETTSTLNVGIEGALFDNSVTFSFEKYKSETTNMLLKSAGDITLIGTVTSPYGNLGSLENKGFDLSVGYNGKIGKDIKFNVGANLSQYKNKVLTLTSNPNYFLTGSVNGAGGAPARTQAGHEIASFYGFQIDGIIQNQAEKDAAADYQGKDVGTWKYRDINNDGTINDSDRTYIGSPHPDFTYGLNLGMEYKAFDLAILLQGSQGNDIYNFTKNFTDLNGYGAKSYNYLNSWTPENPGATLPKLTNNPAQFYTDASSYYIEDGSYLRLKNIQIGFNFPKRIATSIGLESLRIYLQGKNLITWTKYSGLDPEINLKTYGGNGANLDIGIDRGAYPVSKSILTGINLSF